MSDGQAELFPGWSEPEVDATAERLSAGKIRDSDVTAQVAMDMYRTGLKEGLKVGAQVGWRAQARRMVNPELGAEAADGYEDLARITEQGAHLIEREVDRWLERHGRTGGRQNDG